MRRYPDADPWDFDNSILLAPKCHMNHHSAYRKLGIGVLPRRAILYAVQLMGEDAALLYLARRYAP